MSTPLAAIRRIVRRPERRAEAAEAPRALEPEPELAPVEIAETDPIVPYFQSATGPVDIDSLELDSPALAALREAGVKLVVPLVSQGELIGLLNLGPRLSEQEYSGDDRKLLENLATQAGPALQVAQLVRRQEAEARARARIEQELRVAQLIQQNFLPKELPELSGWHVAAYYQPAREVGGDFYDFIELPDGHIGVVVGDVTDKGVPAAMMMAATRSVLRAAAQRLISPGEVLERVNDLLCPDMPEKMFVTCLYAVLDPETGRVRFANAGHNLPYVRTEAGAAELYARGMPLGLLPGMRYEENEARIEPGEAILFHSDGLAEAHDVDREMFGMPRLMELVGAPREDDLIDLLLGELAAFTGPGWEQEDDITLVTVQRSQGAAIVRTVAPGGHAREHDSSPEANGRVLADFTVPSEPGNERRAMQLVEDAVRELALPATRLEQLKTAVAEATMNAMEHGNRYQADVPVAVTVLASDAEIRIRITDEGGGRDLSEPETPDLEAKLAGLQRPRGWGLFLIQNMVDEMEITSDERHHTVELVLRREGGGDGNGVD
jgi:serine phosphatase RsbU (regulator of sigma subunit)/anti-sigma regulatory factor (Ser/Thr protein kinase)